MPILEPSRRQAPQEERFDENGGCLHPLSAPFLGSSGNKTPIFHWIASNSRWGRPVLQLTPPDPSPSVTGFPTPRHFSLWDQGLGGGEWGALRGTVESHRSQVGLETDIELRVTCDSLAFAFQVLGLQVCGTTPALWLEMCSLGGWTPKHCSFSSPDGKQTSKAVPQRLQPGK